eukprot:15349136-Ditylum_brightwellii.AAC.2
MGDFTEMAVEAIVVHGRGNVGVVDCMSLGPTVEMDDCGEEHLAFHFWKRCCQKQKAAFLA